MKFDDFLQQWVAEDSVSTEDVLASILPLVREVIAAHSAGCVGPLEGLQDLNVEQSHIWFEEGKRRPPRHNTAELARLERGSRMPVEILAEARRTVDVSEGEETLVRAEIGERGAPITRAVYLPGYVAWEHEIQHHDPLTDIFSLGMLLASLACQLNLNEPDALASFVTHRRNLFALNPGLHPAIAQAILRMTELDRHPRAQDLPALLHSLENYRDQAVSFDIDLTRISGFRTRDARTRQQVVLTKLRDRLFDISRRNNLLHFRPTMQSVNLTQSSIPLLLDIRNIREDQVLVWHEGLRQQIAETRPISLNKHLNFNEALYLPSLLERILTDARRDQHEFGFAQLRLVLCFLSWANVKEKPIEQFISPLVFLPVRLVKNRGIRDVYSLEPLSSEAEVNPVLRHQFRQLYNIELPELVDLATTKLETLFEFLSAKIQASEPAVTLTLIDRPRIDLIHEKARRRLDHYRRSARVSGRGVRHFGDLDYSYDPANYHPLGIKLFSALVRAPGNHLRELVEERPRPRSYAAELQVNAAEVEKSFFHLRDSVEENPYLWNFDLCNLTLANFHYRRMSLVRDYESILEANPTNPAFEATFSLSPRPIRRDLPAAPVLAERFDVVPCDPTQATAIAEARRGECYIIQGPPGTGKSQTITNLIADFVALGKRVLFVCEKRAAIDVVFARLRQCGLGSLCSLIHDSQTDKKEFVLDLKQTYEQLLEEKKGPSDPAKARETALDRLQQILAPLERFEVAMEADLSKVGMPTRQFLDRCIELADARPAVAAEEAECLPRYQDWRQHAERLASLEPVIRDLEPSGVFARYSLRRLAPTLAQCERPIERVTTACGKSFALLERLVQVLRGSGIPADQWNTLAQVKQLLDYMKQARRLVRHGNLELSDPVSERSKQFDGAMKSVARAEAALSLARQKTSAWRHKFSPSDLEMALEQARQWEHSLFAWLTSGWWRLRGVLRRSYDFRAHAVRPSWTQVLAALQQEYDAQSALERTVDDARTTRGIEGDLREFQEFLAGFRKRLSHLAAGLRQIHAALRKSAKAEAFIERTLAAEEPVTRLGDELVKFVVETDNVPLDELRVELMAIQRGARHVPQVLSLLGELETLPAAIGTLLRQMPFNLRQAEAAVAHRTWEELLRNERDLGRFNGRLRTRHALRLESSYDRWLEANAAEICSRLRQRFLENIRRANLAGSQLSPADREFKRQYSQGRRALEHEFGKMMRYRAIRELVDGDTALVIQDLKPVWLMSPLSVSDTLPLAEDLFDVVIFDEASQVPLEESVPTLFRGSQVIIVGDEMQLPPTDFFSARRDDEEEEFVINEGGQSLHYDLDSDSLLNQAARNLPSTMLGWHYRSRSESLISFSNWAFYDGRLLTVPEHRLPEVPAASSDPPNAYAAPSAVEQLLSRPLSFHLLKDGIYDQRRNRREAEHIAQLVCGLLKGRAGLTIGVIAFSEAQQAEIESALSRMAQDDDEFRGLFDAELEREIDGQFVGLLVKNLENIQGDERDVVILSICYGPGPHGKVLMNFGPINKSGGEKRLNVAFSRAKQHMAVVSSIQHTAITNDYNDGANCLKNYLRYTEAVSQGDVETGRRVLAGISRWRDSSSPAVHESEDNLCRQLAAALRRNGYVVDSCVGQSHFRVDVAVRRPEDAQYRLGILVDTAAYYEQAEALEREMMRPRLLRAFGWPVATVLAVDWYADRERELERILNLIEGSKTDPGSDTEIADEGDEEAPGKDAPAQGSDELAMPQSEPAMNDGDVRDDNGSKPIDSAGNEANASNADPDGVLVATGSLVGDAQALPLSGDNCRYFEFHDDKSNKFWEIRVVGNQHTVRFGRVGSSGQSQTKIFADESLTRRDADRLIREKTRKGYREIPAAD